MARSAKKGTAVTGDDGGRPGLLARTGMALRSVAGGAAGRVSVLWQRAVERAREGIEEKRTIRPEPIGPGKRNLKKIFTYALFGVAALIVVARINNARGFTVAAVVAVGLGVVYIAWSGYRSAIATAAAIGWWVLTTPLIALASSYGLDSDEAMARLAGSAEAIIGTGIAVWVCSVLMRVRRPWVTIVVCWTINATAVLLAGYAMPRFALAAGWAAIALYLAWRAGWLLALYDRLRGRTRMGRVYASATEEQYEVYNELADLPGSFHKLYQLAVPAEFKPAVTVDGLVIAPTGLFFVTAVDGLGRISLNISESRRVAVEGASIDGELLDIARTARALAAALRVEVVPLVAMCGSTFPTNTPGLLPVGVTLPGERDAVPLTLIDPALLSRRIQFGSPVYTAGQVQRIVHRAKSTLVPASPAEASTVRKHGKRRRLAFRKDKFIPGVEVEWTDESGTWTGWVCVSGITVLTEVPKGVLASTVAVDDKVVWIVSKAEWEKARAQGREPDPELVQPVPVGALRRVRTSAETEQTHPHGGGTTT